MDDKSYKKEDLKESEEKLKYYTTLYKLPKYLEKVTQQIIFIYIQIFFSAFFIQIYYYLILLFFILLYLFF